MVNLYSFKVLRSLDSRLPSGTQITSIPRTKHQRVAHFGHVPADHGTQFAAENNTILRRRARIDLSRKLDCNLL